MTAVAIHQAELHFPVIIFPAQMDAMPFEESGLLLGKTGWLAEHGLHRGLEIVDSRERRWIVSGIVQHEPIPKRWWQSRRSADPDRFLPEVEIREIEGHAFDATKARLEAQAALLFEDDDDALAAIRAATDMAELSAACFDIMIRAQGRRIIAGQADIPIRSEDEVVRRALILFATVQMSLGADRLNILESLNANDLVEYLSPEEGGLFTKLRLPEEARLKAGWDIEALAALLWALGLADMPPAGEFAVIENVMPVVAPSGDIDVGALSSIANLRSHLDLAVMAENHLRGLRRDGGGDLTEAIHRRFLALQWIINPDRLTWP